MFGNTECGISSGALLFAYMNIMEKLNKIDKLLLMPLIRLGKSIWFIWVKLAAKTNFL